MDLIIPSTIVISTATIRAITTETVKEAKSILFKKYAHSKALKQISIENEDLIAAISKLMLVKTLFSGADKPVNLFDFYQKPKLKYNDNIYSIDTIEDISKKSEINNCKNFILRGTVGQGKSIQMRYLAINDLITHKRIPIFIELKNISKSKNINFLIKEYLSSWIYNNDDEIVKYLLRSGVVSLFLDAFDEVDSDLLQETYADISSLCQSYKNLIVVVSSRPETIITKNALFEMIDLCPYSIDEQIGLINKLVENVENKKILIETIDKSTHEVKEVLTTPLMVVLFIKQYVVGFSVPHHVADFYKNIFDVVTFTHDRSKGIEKRNSYSSLNQEQLETIFERFCFETFLIERTIFDKKEFINLLKKSIEKNNIKDFNDFHNLIYDYTRFACLILQDGNEYTFIHKSIQEYYVAKFIENLPENLAEKVIDKKLKNNFNNENYLNFLKVLKPYFYNKYYIIKSLDKYKEVLNIDFKNDDDNFIFFLKSLYVCYGVFKEEKIYLGVRYVEHVFMFISQVLIFPMLDDLENEKIVNKGLICWISEDKILKNDDEDKILKNDDERYISLIEEYGIDRLKNIKALRDLWDQLCLCYHKNLLEVYKVENSVSEDELDI